AWMWDSELNSARSVRETVLCCSTFCVSSLNWSATAKSPARSWPPRCPCSPVNQREAERPCAGEWRYGRRPYHLDFLLDVAQASSLATQGTQIIQLGAADLRGTQDVHLVDHLRVGREDALDPVTEADLAHREAGLRAVALRDHDAFEGLEAFFVAFLDLHLNADCIARPEGGEIRTLGLCEKLFNYQIARHVDSFMNL